MLQENSFSATIGIEVNGHKLTGSNATGPVGRNLCQATLFSVSFNENAGKSGSVGHYMYRLQQHIFLVSAMFRT